MLIKKFTPSQNPFQYALNSRVRWHQFTDGAGVSTLQPLLQLPTLN